MPKLTGDEYIALLTQRMEEHHQKIGREPDPRWPALLEWFIRDGDEELFTPPSERKPKPAKPAPQPRKYLPADYWRDELARIDTRLAAINGVQRHATDDLAAYGGIGVRQTPRQRAKYGARLDRAAAEHVRLSTRRKAVAEKLRRAEEREAK